MDLSNLSTNLPPSKPVTPANMGNLFNDLTVEFKNAAKLVASLYSMTVTNTATSDKLTTEFASAAKSVASLYRLCNTSGSLQQHKGYLQCLDDMLDVISQDGDIENWALTKKAELTYERKEDDYDKEKPEDVKFPNSEGSQKTPSTNSSSSVDVVNMSGDTTACDDTVETIKDNFGQILSLDQLHNIIDKLGSNKEADMDFSFSHDLKPYRTFVPSLPLLSVQHNPKSLEKYKKSKIIKKLRDDSSLESDHEEEQDKTIKKRKLIQPDNF
jgi:hypothetical protein